MISILVALILSMTSHLLAATVDHPRPYKQAEINHIYNLLFADDINLLRSNDKPPKNSPLEVLLASKPDPTAVQKSLPPTRARRVESDCWLLAGCV